jgi:hypothetical protein
MEVRNLFRKIKYPIELYDKNGNLIYHENSSGFWTKREYDKNGNQIYMINSMGLWAKNEFDDQGNQIYWENKYKVFQDDRINKGVKMSTELKQKLQEKVARNEPIRKDRIELDIYHFMSKAAEEGAISTVIEGVEVSTQKYNQSQFQIVKEYLDENEIYYRVLNTYKNTNGNDTKDIFIQWGEKEVTDEN